MNKQTILIIGAGQIGTFLSATFSNYSNYKIVLADSNPSLGYIQRYGHDDAEVIKMNVNNSAQVEQCFKNYRPNIVILCFGDSTQQVELSPETAKELIDYGLKNILANVKKYQTSHLMYVSSVAVYGNQTSEYLHEGLQPHSNSQYGINKLHAENTLALAASEKLKITVFRCSGTYGPIKLNKGSQSARILENFLLCGTNDITVPLPFTQYFDEIIYIKDVAHAINSVVTKKSSVPRKAFEILNVGTGYILETNTLLDSLSQLFPEMRIDKIPYTEQKHKRHIPMNISKIATLYGFKPTYTLTEALIDYLSISNFKIHAEHANNG